MDTLPIINKTYDLYKQIIDITEHLNKRWRFSLGKSIEDTALNLLSELIMAKNAPKPLKAGYLIRACSRQETCVLKLRLCLELKLVNETKIFQAQSTLEEIGRMLGGWLKSVQSS
ncbi:MAG: four helix bundle protein [Patescibacteria group bacterium]